MSPKVRHDSSDPSDDFELLDDASGSDRRSSRPGRGTLIDGRYRVSSPIGKGAMGVVLLAKDERLDRQVAVKIIRATKIGSQRVRDRLMAEARAMARVRHENVVAIYDVGEHDGHPFIVMEYIPGDSLEYWLSSRAGAPLPFDQAFPILDGVCRGVQAIHDSGTVHGDLKPKNVLIGPAFRVAVADLGFARPVSELGGGQRILTGTPAYIAPEKATKEPVDPLLARRADVYSLGVLTFEVLTGRMPFEAEDVTTMLLLHASEDPPLPSELVEGLPAGVDKAVIEALAKRPEERTPTAEELRKALTNAAAQARPTESFEGVRMLVADDDEDFRNFAVACLEESFSGAEIFWAADGNDALTAVRTSRYSLAMIDLHMPGLGGVELTAALRATENGKDMPIIVVTAYGGADDWQILSAMGASGFLVKPVDPMTIIANVRKVLAEGSAVVSAD